MAKKLKKYPKKPAAKASVETLKKYLEKRKEIDKYNAKIQADEKERLKLKKQISGL